MKLVCGVSENLRCRLKSRSMVTRRRRASALPKPSRPLGYGAGIAITLREVLDGARFKTDGGNVIYDCAFGAIKNAAKLAATLDGVTGAVEHGLFIGLATTLVIASSKGIEIFNRQTTSPASE